MQKYIYAKSATYCTFSSYIATSKVLTGQRNPPHPAPSQHRLPAQALLASSEMATPPGSCSGDKSSNSYSAAGGSDGDSDDDDDDAIARLFSIGGVKRKRGRGNSDSQQQQQQQGSGGGSGAVHHSGPVRMLVRFVLWSRVGLGWG